LVYETRETREKEVIITEKETLLLKKVLYNCKRMFKFAYDLIHLITNLILFL